VGEAGRALEGQRAAKEFAAESGSARRRCRGGAGTFDGRRRKRSLRSRAHARVASLFRIERSLADAPRRKKEKIREKRSRHIVDAFFSWCDAEASSVLDDTPISAGIRSARNQRVGLAQFLEDGRLPLHNNMSELALRREAIGRKNWLFVGSDDGGAVNATFTSLLASAQLCDVEPWAYLRDSFCLLPSWPAHELLELAPLKWKQTALRNDVRARLDANRFRRLTLDARD
jgi:transposase